MTTEKFQLLLRPRFRGEFPITWAQYEMRIQVLKIKLATRKCIVRKILSRLEVRNFKAFHVRRSYFICKWSEARTETPEVQVSERQIAADFDW